MSDRSPLLAPQPKVSVRQIQKWAEYAPAGDTLTYHRGWLCRDRSEVESVDRLAWAVEQLEADGVITIVHRRLAQGPFLAPRFDYIALRLRARYVVRPYSLLDRRCASRSGHVPSSIGYAA